MGDGEMTLQTRHRHADRATKILWDGCPFTWRPDGHFGAIDCGGVMMRVGDDLDCARCNSRFCSVCGGTIVKGRARTSNDWPSCTCSRIAIPVDGGVMAKEWPKAKVESSTVSFDADAICRKCLGRDVSVEYRDYRSTGHGVEYLRRTCRRCGFGWLEDVPTDDRVEEARRGRKTATVEPTLTEDVERPHEIGAYVVTAPKRGERERFLADEYVERRRRGLGRVVRHAPGTYLFYTVEHWDGSSSLYYHDELSAAKSPEEKK